MYSLESRRIVSTKGLCRKKGPKVKEPILLINLLIFIPEKILRFSLMNKNTAQE